MVESPFDKNKHCITILNLVYIDIGKLVETKATEAPIKRRNRDDSAFDYNNSNNFLLLLNSTWTKSGASLLYLACRVLQGKERAFPSIVVYFHLVWAIL